MKNIYLFVRNFSGRGVGRKALLIESDDWGSIRMPNIKVYNELLASGIRVDQCPYSKYDTLESENDLTALFECLMRFRDSKGKPAVITANTIMANPDFDKIEREEFTSYSYEEFDHTYSRYPGCKGSSQLVDEAISLGCWHPQFHGREHLNVMRWLRSLKNNSPETRKAFDCRLFGLSTNITSEKRRSYLAALELDSDADISFHLDSLKDGLALFMKRFSFLPKSFIAPNYTWNDTHEELLFDSGVRFLQGCRSQQFSQVGRVIVRKHKMGSISDKGLIRFVRNVSFEPSLNRTSDPVGSALREINAAFLMGKPAIINSHRLNFIGGMNEGNRTKNLIFLKELLTRVLQRWPSVEFLHSSQLGEYYM